MNAPEAYPQGYVEDAFEARTKLAGISASCYSTTTAVPLALTINMLPLAPMVS